MADQDLASLTATAAAGLMREGKISSVELVEACLNRVSAREKDVNAFAFIDPEFALDQARRADEFRRAGKGVGPLHGIPVGVKDIVDTADMPTEHGFPAFSGRRPRHDAFLVAQLRAAGAIILGKTVSSPLANPGPIKTRNPLDVTRNPGTSSSGSAAAVAAHMLPLSVGSQTAGSVIRPASFCGIFGFKPTFGLISRSGVLLQSDTLDTMGVMARSVEDLALLTDAIAGFDASDPGSLHVSRPSLLSIASCEVPIPPLFAFVKSPFWGNASSVVHEAFDELVETLGDQCRPMEFASLDSVYDAMTSILAAENAVHYGALYDRHGEHMSPLLKTTIENGRKVTAETYLKAKALRETVYETVDEILINHGCIMTLSADSVAPKIDALFTPNYNGVWTTLGVPAVSLPLLEIDGLPIGVQLVGARNDDGRLLRTARWLVQHLANLH